jgi:ABC-type transport system involved in cytochrome bd biosynthesis fused ATPase/permease subunit
MPGAGHLFGREIDGKPWSVPCFSCIFDEATSSLDSATAEHFAATINQLRGKVTMLFITHALPKGLQVDEVVRIGGGNAGAGAHEPGQGWSVITDRKPK